MEILQIGQHLPKLRVVFMKHGVYTAIEYKKVSYRKQIARQHS